jgi:hypothetical protein
MTYNNAVDVLLKEQYTTFDIGVPNQDLDRHDFLQQALHSTFDQLSTGSLPAPKELSAVLDPAVRDGRISFWSFNPSEDNLIRRLGMDGSFPRARGRDVFAVTTQNSGNNKIDAFLHKTFLDQVTFNPSTGSVRSVVTITLTNDAPTSGLPSVVIDSPGVPSTPVGTNLTWLTLYSPLFFDHVDVNGVRGGMTVGQELGMNAYSAFIDVPSESTVRLTVHLFGHIDKGLSYRLALRLQPSANPQSTIVEVRAAPGWRLSGDQKGMRWFVGAAMRQARTFSFVKS